MQTCHQTIIIEQWPITLEQSASGAFRVTYGKQVTSGLSYAAAAAEYGSCIMHALACEGKLDSSLDD